MNAVEDGGIRWNTLEDGGIRWPKYSPEYLQNNLECCLLLIFFLFFYWSATMTPQRSPSNYPLTDASFLGVQKAESPAHPDNLLDVRCPSLNGLYIHPLTFSKGHLKSNKISCLVKQAPGLWSIQHRFLTHTYFIWNHWNITYKSIFIENRVKSYIIQVGRLLEPDGQSHDFWGFLPLYITLVASLLCLMSFLQL